MRKVKVTVLAVTALALAGAAAGPTLIESTWDLGANGLWNVPGNWDPATVPNNDTNSVFDVTIDGGVSDVVVSLNIVTDINDLTVTDGDELSFLNSFDLTIRGGEITNDGIISMNSTAATTNLTIDGDTTIDGSGVLALGGNPANRLIAQTTLDRLTNSADHSIVGGGSIGENSMSLTNLGTIDADDPLSEVFLDPPTGGDFTNQNVMRASNGGLLRFGSGTYLNNGGLIEADDTSLVAFAGTLTIDGGELSTTGSGALQCVANLPRFINVLNNGDLIVDNSIDPIIQGTLVNNGAVMLESTGATTNMRIDGDVTLSGGGDVLLANGNTNNIISAITTLDRLTNVDNLIHGSGTIGSNSMSLTNQSTIVADNPGGALTFNPPTSGDFTNEGTFEADGGTLILLSGTYDNTFGSLIARDGSEIRLNGTLSVIGGTLISEGSGFIRCTANTPTLIDVTNQADLQIANAIDPVLIGSLTNNATLTFDTATASSMLRVNGDVTLDGGGTIHMANSNAANSISAINTLDRLTNVDNLIRGSGSIGSNSMSLTNNHVVEADDLATPLILNPPTNGDFTNNNVMRAANGAMLQLTSGTYLNGNGTISAADASTVATVGSAVINGGICDTDGSGVFQLGGTPRLINVTNNGNMRIPNSIDPIFETTFVNTATLTCDGNGATSSLSMQDNVALSGGGTVDLGASLANRLVAVVTNNRLTNVDNLIRGGGSIGGNSLSLTNEGAVQADHPTTPIVLNPPTNGDHTNLGLIHAMGDAGIEINAGPFDNQGDVLIDANSILQRFSEDYVQTAGTTMVLGTLEVTTGDVAIQGGSLMGTGTVDGTLAPDGGSVDPGLSAGTLNVLGDFEPTINGSLNIELAGLLPGEFDVLAIDGDAFLAGSLNVTAIDDFVPTKGDEFTILTTTGTVSGEFDLVNCTNFVIHYDVDAVRIEILFDINVADINCDGSVDVSDLLILLAEWGPCPDDGPCAADINNSGAVEINDLLLLLANWGG